MQLAEHMPCWHSASMSIQITVRDVPEKVRDELAVRWLGLFGQFLALDKWKVLPLGSTRVRHSASSLWSSISFHRLHSHAV